MQLITINHLKALLLDSVVVFILLMKRINVFHFFGINFFVAETLSGNIKQ